MISFEWDARKATSNVRAHGISFEEAQSVFYDEFAIQYFDEEHSGTEDRFILLGVSGLARLLVVVHCVREAETIRIISARRATKTEGMYYEGPGR